MPIGKLAHIKLAIFDLDGTLVDAYSAIIKSFNYTMRALNLPTQSPQIIRRAVGWGDEFLLRPFVKEIQLKKGLSIYRNHHKKALLKYSRLFPNVMRLLHFLKSNDYKLAMASNRPTRFSLILIRHLGLNKYFDYVLCADKLKHGKPDPEILNAIMKHFKVRPGQTVYVGDMAIDAQAARRAKIKSIIITTGSSTKDEINKERPYGIITRLIELIKLL